MLGGADNPNGELLSYIIGADNTGAMTTPRTATHASPSGGERSPHSQRSWPRDTALGCT